MGFKEEYGNAVVEVLEFLENTNEKELEKIPQSFINFLLDNTSLDYNVNFEHSKTISELDLSKKAKEILGVIYVNWWCNDSEKRKYSERILEYETKRDAKLREKNSCINKPSFPKFISKFFS